MFWYAKATTIKRCKHSLIYSSRYLRLSFQSALAPPFSLLYYELDWLSRGDHGNQWYPATSGLPARRYLYPAVLL